MLDSVDGEIFQPITAQLNTTAAGTIVTEFSDYVVEPERGISGHEREKVIRPDVGGQSETIALAFRFGFVRETLPRVDLRGVQNVSPSKGRLTPYTFPQSSSSH